MIRIAVIDGQGGGIGTAIIKRIKEVFGNAPNCGRLEQMQ